MSDDTATPTEAETKPAAAAAAAEDSAPLVSDLVDTEKVHRLDLVRGAVGLLAFALKTHGWTKSPKKSRHANRLRKRLAAMAGKEPKHEDEEAADAWAAVPAPVRMGERDRDMCKECVRHFTAAGAFDNTDQVENLFDELGLVEE